MESPYPLWGILAPETVQCVCVCDTVCARPQAAGAVVVVGVD
jgi:hypothetical protein